MTTEDASKKGGFAVLNGSATPRTEALFAPGPFALSPGVLAMVPLDDVIHCLFARHIYGDWGNLDRPDRKRNDEALQDGSPVISLYRASNRIKFWIVTEWNEIGRTWTTVFLSNEW